ncbi:MAG: AEC family transporter [Clostridia bacterium]|nr:AEC family transporter [Clostridia bacterium]
MIALFLNVLTQVVILLILICLGVVLTKTKVLTQKGIASMTDMILYLVTPCVIIKSFMREFDVTVLKKLLFCFLITFLLHIGLIIGANLLIRTKDIKKERVLRFAAIFSNCGYMAIPLQQALIGDEGVFYAAAFIAVFQVFIWSYGIILMSGDKKYISAKKMLINPGVIGLTIGLIFFLLPLEVPKVVSEPISYMASLNTPLPMIVIGYHLANSNLLKGFKDKHCLLTIAVRLVILPLAALGILYLCGIRGNILIAVMICTCMPAATINTMLASKFSGDTESSVNVVSISTVLSLITIPLIVSFTQYIA